MEVIDLDIEGLKLVKPTQHSDSRGFFMERFNKRDFGLNDLPTNFVQDNHSRSSQGVLRGFHYQFKEPQGKLVGVVSGAIWDVAIDLRWNSPTFGKSFGIELNEENSYLLWIPPGFAHGFAVLNRSKMADVLYKATSLYNPDGERGLRWNDPNINVKWPIHQPLVSQRDQSLGSFFEYKSSDLAHNKWWEV